MRSAGCLRHPDAPRSRERASSPVHSARGCSRLTELFPARSRGAASERPRPAQRASPRRYGRAPRSSEAALSSLLLEDRCSGFERHAATFRTRCLLHRGIYLGDDALLLLLVRLGVTLSWTRAVGTTDVSGRQRVARRHPEPRRDVRPRTLILRLFLRPDDFLDRRIQIDDLRYLTSRPGIQLLDSHDRHVGRALGDEIVVNLSRAEHESRYHLARL